uniref:Uncharacterized protein n=1 Tax=Arundo donax TaxID=35708 RepID=A0A0A9CG04_ARUDO
MLLCSSSTAARTATRSSVVWFRLAFACSSSSKIECEGCCGFPSTPSISTSVLMFSGCCSSGPPTETRSVPSEFTAAGVVSVVALCIFSFKSAMIFLVASSSFNTSSVSLSLTASSFSSCSACSSTLTASSVCAQCSCFFEGENMRLTRSELQAALPPKRSTASRTDSNGADVSISALPPPAPSAAAAAGAAHSGSELMGNGGVNFLAVSGFAWRVERKI